jgi:enamine deaminase RidA (YjgF/YER057c/UK114 family)
MRTLSFILLASILILAVHPAGAQRRKKKDEEPVTQVLEVPKGPPAAARMPARNLLFFTSPLSNRGLLSQQVRDALRALQRQAGNAQLVRLRAFTAGTGDMRRVQAIVSETFTDRRLPLPALTVVQVGAFPMEGAQVVIEATASARKPVHAAGVAFFSGVGATDKDPAAPGMPLLEKAITGLQNAMHQAGAGPALRVSCFVSSLDQYPQMNSRLATAFPKAASVLLQAQRAHASSLAECESVAALTRPPSKPLELLDTAALVAGDQQVLFTTARIAARYEDEDLRLAFERLKRTLEAEKVSMDRIAFASLYPLTGGISERIKAIRFEFFDKAAPPATTVVAFEALPSVDASFGVDVIAVP